MFRPEAAADDCRIADVIVSLVPVRGACPSPALVVDRFDLWREGAHGIWLAGSDIRFLSVDGVRGDRPWVPRVAGRKRSRAGSGSRPRRIHHAADTSSPGR
jgi:competence protein ComEC